MRYIALIALLTTVTASTLAQQPQMPRGDAARGKALYEANKCADCHRLGESGSRVGPDLSGVGDTRTPEQLTRAIVAPDDEVMGEHRGIRVVLKDGTAVVWQDPESGCLQHSAADVDRAAEVVREDGSSRAHDRHQRADAVLRRASCRASMSPTSSGTCLRGSQPGPRLPRRSRRARHTSASCTPIASRRTGSPMAAAIRASATAC